MDPAQGRSPERGAEYLESGANRDRTDDLLLAKQALSQLSYGPKPAKIVRSRLGW